MLRGDQPTAVRVRALLLLALVGIGAGVLVWLGNPGNMGLCGACFLRDLGGALRLHPGPAILRPEVPGLVLGALLMALFSRRHVGRSGSHAVVRFLLCVAMAIGALVFLGCPSRLLQRLGGGDLHAWLALPGFVAGVGLGRWFERRGYALGRTSEVPLAIGLLGPSCLLGLLVLFVSGGVLAGPGPGDPAPPPHAPWLPALGIGTVAGAVLSATGFCVVSAARQVFSGPRWMLMGAGVVIAGHGVVVLALGVAAPGAAVQPIAHGDWLWNTLALVLVGLTGALAGGCPVRQIVMAGEGNGDAFVGVAGLVVGGALAHALQLASVPATAMAAGGPTAAGKWAVVGALVFAIVYAAAISAAHRRQASGVGRAAAGAP